MVYDWNICQNTWGVFRINQVQMRQSVVGRWQVGGKLQVILGPWLLLGLQLECAIFLHETLLVSVLMFGSEAMIWKKDKFRVRAVLMNNLRGLLGIWRTDKVPNERIYELCGVSKGVDKRINEGFCQWFDHMENMEDKRTAKRVYVEGCAGSCSVGRPQKRVD